MKTLSRCPSCGDELDGHSADEVCSKCLMKKGLQTVGAESLVEEVMHELEDTETTPSKVVSEHPGRYSTLKEHAKGGMGRVLLVHDETLNRDIALKELLPEFHVKTGETPADVRKKREFAARFLREAKITGQLEHPSITPVHELGQRSDGTYYYTMKLVRGRTLGSAIRVCSSLKDRLALLPHFYDLCNAISYAHSRNVLHRDIKPSNVLIGDYGETVVIDWGLAKVRKNEPVQMGSDPDAATIQNMQSGVGASGIRTSLGAVMGTPVYMPPEQAKGLPVDERADIYSLGAVLFEILTGVPPFKGENLETVLSKVIHEVPDSPSSIDKEIDRGLSTICLNALSKLPEDRYQTAEQLGKAVIKWKPTNRAFRVLKRLSKPSIVVLILLLVFFLEEDFRSSSAVDHEMELLSVMDYDEEFFGRFSAESEETNRQLLSSSDISIVNLMGSIGKLFPELNSSNFADNTLLRSEGSLNWTTPMKNSTKQKVRKSIVAHSGMIDMARLLGDIAIDESLHIGSVVRSAQSTSMSEIDFTYFVNWEHFLNLLLLDVRIKIDDGDFEAALESSVDYLTIVSFFSETPLLIDQAISQTYMNTFFRFMQENIEVLSSNSEHLVALDSILQRIGDEKALQQAIETESLVIHPHLLLNASTNSISELVDSELIPNTPTRLGDYFLYKTRVGRSVRNWIYVDHLRNTRKYLDSFDDAHDERLTEFMRLNSDQTRPYPFLRPASKSDLLSIEAFDRQLSLTQLLRGGIALERYRLTNSTYPESLDDLVPEFLEEVPYDYLSDTTLDYSKVQTGYILSSPYTMVDVVQSFAGKVGSDESEGGSLRNLFSRRETIENAEAELKGVANEIERVSRSRLRELLAERRSSGEIELQISRED